MYRTVLMVLFVAISLSPAACSAKETYREYLLWSFPEKPYAVRIAADHAVDAEATASLLRAAGVAPVSTDDSRYGKAVKVGCFQTMLEANFVNQTLRLKGHPQGFVVKLTPGCGASSAYDNPLSSGLQMSKWDTRSASQSDFAVLKESIGSDTSRWISEGERLRAAQSAIQLAGDATTTGSWARMVRALDNLSNGSPSKLPLLISMATAEMESSGSATLLLRYAPVFRDGGLAASQQDYAAAALIFADAFHEFTKDSRSAFVLYEAVAYRLDSAGVSVSQGQKARALTEIAALSREMDRRGVGKKSDVAYWWAEYKRMGLPQSARAALVIQLIALENHFDENMTRLMVEPEFTKAFYDETRRLARDYRTCLRERIFVNHLTLSITPHLPPEEELKVCLDTLEALPLPAEEQAQWAGVRIDYAASHLTRGLAAAERLGDGAAAEKFKAAIARHNQPLARPSLEPHKKFERF